MALTLSGDGTITGLAVGGLPDGTVDSGTLATDSVTSANIADGTITTDDILASDVVSLKSGRKNLIINGAMQVWQRGTSFVTNSFTADRFTSQASATLARSTDAPLGFKYSAYISAWNGNAGYQANQHIENTGQFYAGQKLSISCYLKGNASFTINNLANLYASGLNVSANVENTSANIHQVTSSWSRYTFTTTLADIDYSLMTKLSCYPVGNFTSNSMTSANTLYMTGFQVELGSVATDFEHRSYGEELALCQRYYWKLQSEGTAYTYLTLGGNFVSGSHFITPISFPTEMRVAPTGSHNLQTLSLSTATGAGNINFYFQNQGQHTAAGTGTFSNYNLSTFRTYANGGAYYISPASISSTHLRFGSNGYIQFDAEL